jgi:hypothetical protein
MQSHIAVIDEFGVIMLVNDAWRRFATDNGDEGDETTGTGINYLEVTRRSAALGDVTAERALRGIETVLSGERDQFELRYPCHSPTEERWYLMRVSALRRQSPRNLVISHIDITNEHLAARARARRARRQADERSQAREVAAIKTVAARVAPDEPQHRDELESLYAALLEKAVEQRLYRVTHDLRAETAALAAGLARQSAGPRDVIALHTRTIEKVQTRLNNSRQVQVYLEEGRLLLLEVMGYLAARYREMVIAAIEQRNL